MWVITPARGLFYCFDAKVGGDCLALVQHITGLDVKTRPLSCPLPGLLTITLPPAEESGCDQKGNCLRPGRIRVEAPIHRTGGAAGLYRGGGERILYRLLPRPSLHSNPPLGRLDQRLCRLRRWADEASAEVAPRYFPRGYSFKSA